jgi:hypothetical protein
MTKLRHGEAIRLLVLGLLSILPVTCRAQQLPPIAEKLASTYGLQSFKKIDAVRYTFNAQFSGLSLSRSWVWQPSTGQVSYEGKGKDGNPLKVTYIRSQLNDGPANVKGEIDPAFLNDQYNLFFPLHVYWDGAAVEDAGIQKLPLEKGSAERIVVKYSSGGYTPGDTWELYIGGNGRVEEFAYHRGEPKKPSLVIATWAGYKRAGPLLVSTDRRGTADGKPLRIFFTHVAVKLVGSKRWLDAR